MTWPREDSRPRINPDSRRAGLITLLVGGLVVAGLLVMLVPAEQRFGDGKLYCGTPLSAAFKSVRDYETQYDQEHQPPSGTTVSGAGLVGPSLRDLQLAGAACVSDGRTRTSIGAGLLLLAVVAGLILALTRRRSGAGSIAERRLLSGRLTGEPGLGPPGRGA